MKSLDYPLMDNNILKSDRKKLIKFLKQDKFLTQSENVKKFEEEWSKWLGVKYSLFVNSGASANLATITALKYIYGDGGEIIVPPLTWVSDISSVIWNGFTPVFADIDLNHLGMAEDEILKKITDKTRAVFITYVLGFNCLSEKLLSELKARKIILIEDVCESHGATFNNKKLGNFGLASNFSFYYAHHLSTIEGGMICTDDENFYDICRMLRSHGMVRESLSQYTKNKYREQFPEVNPEFTFSFPAFNIRSTELNAVIGRNQLPRLDDNIKLRNENFNLFLNNLDKSKYKTDFYTEGMSNYSMILVLNKPDKQLFEKICNDLTLAGVEYRRGLAGGGNQLRQPYLKDIINPSEYKNYPNVDHVHFYGMYIGNFPSLKKEKILKLCNILNNI